MGSAWWQHGVFYQIYPRSFRDISGDGLGDLAGIRERADYLAWLGIDAVWLSPIYPSPDADLGYDISDYEAVDPRLGTLEDLDRLVEALHERGIRLVLDLVPNHTSDRHQWFVESSSSVDHPRHAWYVWRESAPDGSPPNNWESYFGGPAWDYLDPPGQWYLHSFHRGQPDLNWDHPDVPGAIAEAMRFWLGRGIDGFRVDVFWLLGKDPDLRDNPTRPGWREGDPPWLRLERRFSEDGPRAHERARFLRSVVDEFDDRVMIGEVVLPPERAVAYYGEHLDEAHFPHNFALTEMHAWTAEEVRAVVEGYEAVLPEGAWPNWLLGDHDFSRIATRVGRERARMAQMLLLTLRGTPTCYYGDELGMLDADFASVALNVSDPQGAMPGRDRLVARTPMHWSSAPFAGFSHAETWVPLASDDPTLTVEAQRGDGRSMLSLFRSLIELRRRTPALTVGTFASLAAPEEVFSYERAHPTGSVEIHLNFGGATKEIDLRGPAAVLLSTAGPTPSGREKVELGPYEGVIAGAGPP